MLNIDWAFNYLFYWLLSSLPIFNIQYIQHLIDNILDFKSDIHLFRFRMRLTGKDISFGDFVII